MSIQVAAMPRQKRNDTSVKIDAEVVRKARTMASYKDITLAEFLSEILKPIVEQQFEDFSKQLHDSSKRPSPRTK